MAQRHTEFDAPIKATERSFAILEEIKRRDGAGVTELSTHFGLSKSTIHEHLTTLVQMNYLRRNGEQYEIGLRFLTLGGYSRARELFYQIGRSEVEDLAEETGESSNLVVEEHGRGIYLHKASGERAVQTDSHVGTRVHLHACAVGKAILAQSPEERVEEIVDQWGLPERTDNTITDEAELHEELSTIRNRGYAIDDEERIRGLRCVAVPVLKEDEVLGAISVSGPTKRIGDDAIEELADLVRNTARVIEINAKYTT